MSLTLFDETVPESFAIVLDDANTPGALDLTNSDKVLRRIDSILVASNDTVDRVIQLRLSQGGNYYWLGSLNVPAGTGFDGTPALDLLASVLPATQVGLNLFVFVILQVNAPAAVSSGKGIWLTTFGGTF